MKTATYGYPDAQALGLTAGTRSASWVGWPDGAPMPGLYGRTAAAPILFDAFACSGKPIALLTTPPRSASFCDHCQTAAAAVSVPAGRAAHERDR